MSLQSLVRRYQDEVFPRIAANLQSKLKRIPAPDVVPESKTLWDVFATVTQQGISMLEGSVEEAIYPYLNEALKKLSDTEKALLSVDFESTEDDPSTGIDEQRLIDQTTSELRRLANDED